MKNKKRLIAISILCVLISILALSCTNSNMNLKNKEGVITPISETRDSESTQTVPEIVTPQATVSYSHDVILHNVDSPQNNYIEGDNLILPNLWTKIEPSKINFFLSKGTYDYTRAKDGSLWAVGDYGIIHQYTEGIIIWYSMKDGLPVNTFTRIAISPSGEIWVGGSNNSLLRFSNGKWIDEGSKFPEPIDTRSDWLCYSKSIAGIDFDQNGNIWVMNSGIELYTQVYGVWINFPFPKDLLPVAGGGACPAGLRVISNENITIKRDGCCESEPISYHFNGDTWIEAKDYSSVDDLLEDRQKGINVQTDINQVIYDFLNQKIHYLPDYLWERDILLNNDQEGTIWLYSGGELYNNSDENFSNIRDVSEIQTDLNLQDSSLINIGKDVVFYEMGKSPDLLSSIFFRYFSKIEDMSNPTIDDQNRIWTYLADYGLLMMDKGEYSFQGVNSQLNLSSVGGTLYMNDGSVAVGSTGTIWIYKDHNWKKLSIPHNDQQMVFLKQNKSGDIFAATDTGVIQISGWDYKEKNFVIQDSKPVVFSDSISRENCQFTKYFVYINCVTLTDGSPIVHYSAIYFDIKEDGTIYYANNKIISRYKDGLWKSFYFDTNNILAATVNNDGSFWIYSDASGLIHLDSNIFDDYVEFVPMTQ